MAISPASQKQLDYLLRLANKKYGTQASYLSQVRTELGLSSSSTRTARGGWSSQAISASCIRPSTSPPWAAAPPGH